MKLFTRYNRINLAATIAIFISASAAFYFTLNYVLLNQVDDDLKIERREILSYVEKYHRMPEAVTVHDQVISYTTTTSDDDKKYFSTVDLSESNHGGPEKFRQLIFGVKASGQWYKVSVSKSMEDTDDLIHSVLIISLTTIFLILLASYITNRFVLQKLWRPFYDALHTVQQFRINKEDKLSFSPVGTEEFSFMNNTLQSLTQQAQADYLALKTFSENASHEIQTPIAIIRSKLDLLIQEEGLTQKQSESLESAYHAVQRLATLNQHLLLLAKIENNQFDAIRDLDLTAAVEKKWADFSELWNAEGIEVHTEIAPAVIKINPDLANILLNNLLSNATKHNYPGGRLFILLDSRQLVIKNSSKEPPLDPQKIFKRFYKPSQSGNSNGLGLSIVKQICDVSGFTIVYAYAEGLHTFTVSNLLKL